MTFLFLSDNSDLELTKFAGFIHYPLECVRFFQKYPVFLKNF